MGFERNMAIIFKAKEGLKVLHSPSSQWVLQTQ
jgi:hypothetical protein